MHKDMTIASGNSTTLDLPGATSMRVYAVRAAQMENDCSWPKADSQ